MMDNSKPTRIEKIRLYKNLFTGLKNVYGTYDLHNGQARQVKEAVTDEVILNHLAGRQPYGVYLLVRDRIKALAVDFDEDDLILPVTFTAIANEYGLPAYIERSKAKGYHIWMLFDRFVPARQARIVAGHVLAKMEKPRTEIFPKQDSLSSNTVYGNFINAPLFGALVPRERTVFLDPDDPTYIHPDQWHLLNTIQRISERQLDAFLENHRIIDTGHKAPVKKTDCAGDVDPLITSSGLLPCGQKMLTEGVTAYQRVCCFRLAVQLKRSGLPVDLAVAALKAWARKNRPANGKRILTEPEIHQQTQSAYAKPYRGIGCEDPAIAAFCHPGCPLKTKTKTLHKGENPC